VILVGIVRGARVRFMMHEWVGVGGGSVYGKCVHIDFGHGMALWGQVYTGIVLLLILFR
jgi:hypothetical protein